MEVNFYRKNGTQCTRDEWSELWKDEGYKLVGKHRFSDGTLVLTVWVGMGPPVGRYLPFIFETVVLRNKKNSTYRTRCNRYSTFEAAELGHEIMVKRMKECVE